MDSSIACTYNLFGSVNGFDGKTKLSITIRETVKNYEGNTDANIIQGGRLATQGNWLYYLIPQLRKEKIDGTDRTTINGVIVNI